ncbi:MAG: hypothetical protein LQ337_001126 [Flavoplaca oasis]|nr:MAG: hypothetical protein LQ337_001126 [Flavoplaca oasis]
MQPWSNGEYAGHSSARYTTGPSTFRGPGNNFAAREEGIRLSNISKMTEPSYGSPSRFIGKSPNPRDQPSNHAARPAGLAFGGYGEGAQSDHAGPKSAPANVKSFDDRAKDEGFRPWNRDDIDDRWGHQIDEVPSSASNSTSRQTSHWDLLQAQLGYTRVQPNGQDHNGTIPATFDTPCDGAASDAFVGRGYDNLARYVAVASSGQQRARVPELERLMMTMLNLRGDNNGLLSIDHSGRDTVRQYMYEQIFDAGDGSSGLSKENPEALVNVGGELMTRQALHHQIMCFLEDKLEDMTRSPSPQVSTPEAEFQSAKTHRPQANNHLTLPETSLSGQQEELPSFRGFEALSLGQQHGGPQQAWEASTDIGTPNMNSQGQPREQQRVTPGLSDGFQDLLYGQLQHGMAPHQLHGSLSPQLVGPHGLFYGNPYAAHPMASMGFYPGGQAVPNVGPMMPYGAHYMRMPQQGLPMGLPHVMPNQQMIMNPYQQQIGRGPSNMMQPPPSQWTPVPGYLGSVYGSMNRAQSPLIRNTNSPFQTRFGRSVVSEVALLPYRPGSDDMFPYGQQGGSVQFQELTRNGGPTYDQAIHPDILPFAENARKAKPAEWGVLRIGNIPYTLTKQEVLGFLGRNAKIITPEYGVAVHIIMDRPTGKTMDCYVEFFSQGDAQAALNKCLMRGNQLRLGDRVVDVHMSSQDELLKELFPRAKNCTWEHGRPKITESTEPYNTGFKAFVTNEELLQTVTWADKPHRHPSKGMLLRPTLEGSNLTSKQFPWSCVDRYTIKTRDELFKSTLSLINILMNELNKANEMYRPNISETLLIDLLYAALNVPAFSEQQRWRLRKAASTTGARVRMSPLAEVWPFEVLGRKVGIDEDVVQVRDVMGLVNKTRRLTCTEICAHSSVTPG